MTGKPETRTTEIYSLEPTLSRGWFERWQRIPLYLRILGALALGVVAGLALGPHAAAFKIPCTLIIRLLGALAPPLILVAVVHSLMTARVKGRIGAKLVTLLIVNTVAAILIGMLVANVVHPGRWAHVDQVTKEASEKKEPGLFEQFLDNVPTSLVKPLVDNQIIGVIFVAIAFGVALRRVREHPIANVEDLVNVVYQTILVILSWVIAVIPLAVFGIVASTVGTKGFHDFIALGAFVAAVLIALLLQACYYMTRVRIESWVRPLDLLRGCRDAMTLAFSTASSTVAMPVTFACLRDKVGLREQSASLGALVGSNFNNDGTALYEAMAALFVSQIMGINLTLHQQFIVVITSVLASVGAAGIPEAGLVTMTLVFTAVQLDPSYIATLLTVDWFLDRSRTVINMMGDMTVSCLLDGRTRAAEPMSNEVTITP